MKPKFKYFYYYSDPIHITTRPWYQLIYIFTAITMANASIILCMMFALFLGLGIFLADFFQHLKKQAIELNKVSTSNEYRQKILKFVSYHNQILDWVDELEDLISLIFLGQFLVSGVIICALMFQLALVCRIKIKYYN